MKSGLLFSYRKVILLTLLFYTAIQVYCINQLSINYDEGLFAAYGSNLLKFQREKDVVLYESKLPITALNMIPRAIEQLLYPNTKKNWSQAQLDIIRGRYISLGVSILLGLLIHAWSRKLYNERTALFVLLSYLLCPNFLAHGIFVSSDIFACLFMTLALYYLWLFVNQRQTIHFVLMSIATGLAEVSKFSMLHLFLLIPLLTAIHFANKKLEGSSIDLKFREMAAYVISFFLINWLIICFAHLWYQPFMPINEYVFKSNSFNGLKDFLTKIISQFPVPFPSSYVRSMDAVMYFDQLGGGVKGSLNGAPYMLGKNSVHGFWYYYFVAIFFKVPVSTLLFWIASFLLLFFHFRRKTFFQNEIFLLLPAVYFLIYMNFFYSTQVGIRHILIIFPLLFIFSGKIISQIIDMKKQSFLFFLLVYETISISMYFPHFLPYTNEFITNKKLTYKKIADTNLCYGEGDKFLRTYLAKNPDAIYMPEKPVAGKVVVEVNKMLRLDISSVNKYDWVRSMSPVKHIHSQYLIFEITKKEKDSLERKYHQR